MVVPNVEKVVVRPRKSELLIFKCKLAIIEARENKHH